MGAVILHVDMDAFFVSVEELYDPSLRGKPVIVGGRPGQRGVVAAASYAARKFGVHSAMPTTHAARLCPDAIFIPAHRDRYHEASERVQEIFRTFSPRVAMVSVDEGYLDLSGTDRLFGSPFRAAHLLHKEMAAKMKLPCSIGISRSRVVSKIASDQAKPNGILWVLPGMEAAFLASLPVSKIPGVGKVTQERLLELGVRRIGDLSGVPRSLLESKLGQYGSVLLAKARGEDCDNSNPASTEWENSQAKSISHEETFNVDVSDNERVETMLADLAQRVGTRLRKHGLYAHTVTLKLRYSNFQTITRAETLNEPTSLDGVILEIARRLLNDNWDRRRKIRLLGVQASSLGDRAGQGNLLTGVNDERWSRALAAADQLRERFGFSSVQLSSAVSSPKAGKASPPAATGKPPSHRRHDG